MKKLLTGVCILVALTGCAKAIRGNNQQVQINAYNKNSNATVSAKCILENDEGKIETYSGRAAQVSRDKDLMTVSCETEDMAGQVTVDGKVNVGYWAIDFFIIDACIISCWVDGLSGAWAEYPSFVDVPMAPKVVTKLEQPKVIQN